MAVFIFRGFFFDWFTINATDFARRRLCAGGKKPLRIQDAGLALAIIGGRDAKARRHCGFSQPGDEIYFVKRIIALPGDKLSYYNGTFYINDSRIRAIAENKNYSYPGGSGNLYREQLPESGWHNILQEEDGRRARIAQAPDDNCALLRLPSGRVLNCQLPEGYYFVAGDNRDHSNDSRYWGLLPESHLIGPAVRVIFNFSSDDNRAGLSLRPSAEPFSPVAPVVPQTDTENADNADKEETQY